MKFSLVEEKLIEKIEEKIPGVTPGVVVQAHLKGKKVCDIGVGKTYVYYDLASLTKSIFTIQALMKIFEDNKWTLQTKVKEIVPWFPHPDTLIVDLLTHSSGLPWWFPFYLNLDLSLPLNQRREKVANMMIEQKMEKQGQSVYSDVGFIMLGFVLEELYQKPLHEIWLQIKEIFYPGLTMDFHLNNEPKNLLKYYAPTEKCAWRGRVLQGEVHDENTWALGGVSSHAGLFGSVDDVGWFTLLLRSQLHGIAKTPVKQKTAKLFASRSKPLGKGDWALGYMMPTPGSSSSGSFFSPYSIGHTGFTGTSYWYDPNQDLSIVILSNRIFYGRDNNEFQALRPLIHNWLIETLKRGYV